MKKINLMTLPNSNFRARRRFGPSSRAASSFVLGRNLRKIPQITIWSCCLVFLTSLNVSALGYSDNVGVNFTFNQSLTVSLSSADIVINNLAPGSASDSNVIDVNILSNNLSGYNLTSTVGNGNNYNDADLTHTNNSSNTFASLSTSDSVSDLSTYDTSGLINPNVWGYSYSDRTVPTPTWSNYSGLPLYDTTGVTLKTSATPSAEDGDTIKFKIAAKASTSQPSGEYRNVINFTVTAEHNPVSFYDAFKEAATKDPTITTLNGYYKMQDMTPSICESVELYDDDSHIQLIDTRDHEVYYIGKLKDNRCWLLDNLRLGGSSEIALTTLDTNIVDNYLLPSSADSGYDVAAQVNAKYKNDITTSYGVGTGKIGAYYNYCAASAGTYCYVMGQGVDIPDTIIDSPYDICPKNWRMPTGTSAGEYKKLYDNYNATQIATDARSLQHNLSTPLSGAYNNHQQDYLGLWGLFWSSTYYDGDAMSRLGVGSELVDINNRDVRNRGRSVRCIADNG